MTARQSRCQEYKIQRRRCASSGVSISRWIRLYGTEYEQNLPLRCARFVVRWCASARAAKSKRFSILSAMQRVPAMAVLRKERFAMILTEFAFLPSVESCRQMWQGRSGEHVLPWSEVHPLKFYTLECFAYNSYRVHLRCW